MLSFLSKTLHERNFASLKTKWLSNMSDFCFDNRILRFP